MTFTQSVQTCFKKYAIFHGRATRSEYWWWFLFTIFASTAASILDFTLAMTFLEGNAGLFITIFWVGTFLPSLAVTVRRLHDINRRGWWLLVWYIGPVGLIIVATLGMLVALVGLPILFIWWIVWFATKGTAGDNRFGSAPLA